MGIYGVKPGFKVDYTSKVPVAEQIEKERARYAAEQAKAAPVTDKRMDTGTGAIVTGSELTPPPDVP